MVTSPLSTRACIDAIEPVNTAVAAQARERVDALTKPLGSLGRIEALAVQLCAIAGTVQIRTNLKAAVLIGAGDHGIAAEGVSAYPAEVTPQMVGAFIGGFAAINAFSRAVGADLYVADFGVRVPSPAHPSLIDARIGAGTANFAHGPAMTYDEVDAALDAGIAAFENIYARENYDVIALGEMGIANTTSAAAMIAALTQSRAEDVVGRGTGVDDHGLTRKITVVDGALQRLTSHDWRTVAHEVGGFEIVGLAGAILAAARRRIPIVLDGFIVSAAALLAYHIAPATRDYCIAAHLSQERGHRVALHALELKPLLDLELRLGEGTGAALALPLIEAASRMVREMKTFAEAGVATAE
jgi:nicotinate-nucleotide--dimethylbenzimidazole phosphoribosyltransferase